MGSGLLARRRLLPLLLVTLAGCGAASVDQAPVAGFWLPKLGELEASPLPVKRLRGGTPPAAAPLGRELRAIVASLEAALAGRRGRYSPVMAREVDNAAMAQRAANQPGYRQLLDQWGRLTGFEAAYQLSGGEEETALLAAEVIISRYRTPDGAHAAYGYVVQNQPTARRIDLDASSGARGPWEEASLFVRALEANGQQLAEYRLIFRAGPLIGFIAHVGLPAAASPRETEALARALFARLPELL